MKQREIYILNPIPSHPCTHAGGFSTIFSPSLVFVALAESLTATAEVPGKCFSTRTQRYVMQFFSFATACAHLNKVYVYKSRQKIHFAQKQQISHHDHLLHYLLQVSVPLYTTLYGTKLFVAPPIINSSSLGSLATADLTHTFGSGRSSSSNQVLFTC